MRSHRFRMIAWSEPSDGSLWQVIDGTLLLGYRRTRTAELDGRWLATANLIVMTSTLPFYLGDDDPPAKRHILRAAMTTVQRARTCRHEYS